MNRLVVALFLFNAFAGRTQTDSPLRIIKDKSLHDTIHIDAYYRLAESIVYKNFEKQKHTSLVHWIFRKK